MKVLLSFTIGEREGKVRDLSTIKDEIRILLKKSFDQDSIAEQITVKYNLSYLYEFGKRCTYERGAHTILA